MPYSGIRFLARSIPLSILHKKDYILARHSYCDGVSNKPNNQPAQLLTAGLDSQFKCYQKNKLFNNSRLER